MIEMYLIDQRLPVGLILVDGLPNYNPRLIMDSGHDHEILLCEKQPDNNEKCLDDFFDKIESQKIFSRGNGLVAYIKTGLLPKEKEEEEENPGFLRRLFAGRKKDKTSLPTVKSTKDAFDVEFKGLETRVFETKTEEGVVYEIFINAALDSIKKAKEKGARNLRPIKTGGREEQAGRKYRRIASFMDSLAQLYERLGISEGKFAFNTRHVLDNKKCRYEDAKEIVPTVKHGKTVKHGNCNFFQVMYEVREDEAEAVDDAIEKITVQEKKEQPKPEEKKQTADIDFTKPAQIKAELDKYIVGQERAKQVLSDAVCKHYIISRYPELAKAKANILLAGPTGCGKTCIAKTVADILGVPLHEVDATELTQTGYKGKEVVDTVLEGLIKKAGSVEKAETSVAFIDEIDKRRDQGDKGFGNDVQGEFLRMLNGDPVQTKNYGEIKTSRILFIFAGAFQELLEYQEPQRRMGFGRQEEEEEEPVPKYILNEKALVKYGFRKDFVGRLEHVCPVDPLTEENLVDILNVQEGSLLEVNKALFEKAGIDLSFTPDAVGYIAQLAYQKQTGARALKGVIDKTLHGLLGDSKYLDEGRLEITRDVVDEQLARYNGE